MSREYQFVSTVNRQQSSANDLGRRRPIKVALVSCGLGHINRGVEVSTARWFEALKEYEQLEVKLFAGGPHSNAQQIDNIPRDLLLDTILSPIAKLNRRRVWEFCYGLEQITFAGGFGSSLLSWKPDVVWTKETPFAHVLAFTRPMFGLKYRLIFANGCGFKPQTYADFDYIQHLHQNSYDEAVQFGISQKKMAVLPNIVPMPKENKTKSECRKHFGYQASDWVICCAAAWNCYHKRIDYLIEEVAKIKDENIKLLLCGHPEPDTAYLKNLADQRLPGRVQWHTLPPEQVSMALTAADIFVLPSLSELFGGVLIEAMMLGIPIIAHHTAASEQLKDLQFNVYDLSCPDNLAKYLTEWRKLPPANDKLAYLAQAVQHMYSEQSLCQQFIDMVEAAVSHVGA